MKMIELSIQATRRAAEPAPKPPMYSKLGKQLSIVTSVHSTRIKPMIVHTKQWHGYKKAIKRDPLG